MNKYVFSLLITMLLLASFVGCSNLNPAELPQGLTPEIKESFEQRIIKNETAIKENSEDIDAIFEVGYSYQLLGNYNRAIRYYDRVLRLAPNHFTALNNSADIYEQAKEYKLAAERIKKLYETNPDNSEVVSDAVRILVASGDSDNAQKALENFIKLKSDQSKEVSPEFISNLYDLIANTKK